MIIAVTVKHLAILSPRLKNPAEMAAAINAALPLGSINTQRRMGHFMAQILHETSGLTRMRENMNYTNPEKLDKTFSNVKSPAHAKSLIAKGGKAIAECAYGGRFGNGPEGSGDGYAYRGGGMIQLTFKANYQRVGDAIGMDLVGNPELLSDPVTAAQAAAKYWAMFGCNAPADKDDIAGVTRAVNGPAMHGLAERKIWRERTRKVWA